MRKSFTRLSGMLVLLLLSVQLAFAAAPQVKTWSPANPGETTSTSPVFTVTFVSDVEEGASGAISLYTAAGSALEVLQVDPNVADDGIDFDGKTVSFSFDEVLKIGSSYQVRIEGKAIVDKASGDVWTNQTWNFNVVGVTPFDLVSKNPLSPKDDATGVALGANFTMTFTENVAFVAGYEQELEDFALYTAKDDYAGQIGGDLVSLEAPTVTINGKVVTIDWAANLDPATKYYVRVKPGILKAAASSAVFDGINTNTAWNFETNVPETITPAVTSTQGAAANKITTDTKFTVNFTEAVFTASGVKLNNTFAKSNVFEVTVGGVAVEGTWAETTSGQVYVFTPKNKLSGSAKYTVKVKATVNDLRDMDGNLVKDASVDFTPGDWIDPVITQMYTANHGGTSFDIFIKGNEKGSVYYIVTLDSAKVEEPTLENILGKDKDGNLIEPKKELIQYRSAAVAPATVGKFYGTRSAKSKSFSQNEIFAEGIITIDQAGKEILERVAGLPATHGREYQVFAVAIDQSTYGVYTPDFSSQGYNGNFSAIKGAEAHTVDILASTFYADADSVGKKALLNKDTDNANDAGVLGLMDRKGQITLNFNEEIEMIASSGSSYEVTASRIAEFVSLKYQGGANIPYTATIADSTTITITANNSFESASTVEVVVKAGVVRDVAGNVFQPAASYLTQAFTVETYDAAIVAFEPAHGETNVDLEEAGSAITVDFSKAIFVPADDEPVALKLTDFSNDPDSKFYIGNYFDIRKNDASGEPIREDFEFVINSAKNKVTITRKEGTAWESEADYYIGVEGEILDCDRDVIEDGAAADHANYKAPFDVETTRNADNVSMIFTYTDIRKPLISFYEISGTPADSVDLVDGRDDVSKNARIGVYIDEKVQVKFAGIKDINAPGANLDLLENAMRRYFKIMHGDVEVKFDVRNVFSNGHLTLELDPYYETATGYKEDPNFETGETYTVKYISSDLEGTEAPVFVDAFGNVVDKAEATFSIDVPKPGPTVEVTYSPTGGEVLASTTTVEFTFNQLFKGTVAPALQFVDENGAFLATLSTVAGATVGDDYKSIVYDIPAAQLPLAATTKYGVTAGAGVFEFMNTATWPAKDSTWYFTTKDETNPWATAYAPTGVGVDVNYDTLGIVFSEPVKALAGKTLYLKETGVEGHTVIWSWDAAGADVTYYGNTVSLAIPESIELTPLTDYHVIIQTSFVTDKSPSANPYAGIADETVWTFRTGDHPAPAYAVFTPADNSVELVNEFSIKFTEAVVPQDNKFIRLYHVDSLAADANAEPLQQWEVDENGTFNSATNTYTFSIPTSSNNDIVKGGVYTFEVQEGAFKDADGNDIYAVVKRNTKVASVVTDPAAWVIEFGDIDAPEITFWPEKGKTNEQYIPYNAYLYIQFSEDIAYVENVVGGRGDVSSVIVDEDNIADFLRLTSSNSGPGVPFTVEFVNFEKRILRIIPNDPNGHEYNGDKYNPTMQTEDTYTLSILESDNGIYIGDIKGNVISTQAVSFDTEDIVEPEVVLGNVTADANSVKVQVTFNDLDKDGNITAGKGSVHVYVVEGKKTKLAGSTIVGEWTKSNFNGTVTSAKINLPETVGAANYTVIAVGEDDEMDKYKDPDGSIWVIAEGESEDRIRDILESPNKSDEVYKQFGTCDDDAPYVVAKDPHMVSNVDLTDNLYITFNEDIVYYGGVDANITLREVATNAAVDAAVSVVNGDSIKIDPVALKQETSYYVEMDRYAVSDDQGCGAVNYAYSEWVGKDSMYFTTIDKTAPVLDSVLIADQTQVERTCINPAIDKFSFYVTEKYDIFTVKGKKMEIYRVTGSGDVLMEIIDMEEAVVEGKVVTVDVTDVVFLNEEEYRVVLAADAVKDGAGNKMSGTSFTFTTWDNVGPKASWEIISLNYHFNNSVDGQGLGNIVSNWEKAKSGVAGATATGISSHSVLKIDFNEEVFVNTSTSSKDNWVSLKNYGGAIKSGDKSTDQVLSAKELLANVQIGDLAYNIDTTKTDLLVIDVDKQFGRSFVIGFKVTESKLYKNAVLDVPNSYENIDWAYAAGDEFVGSLALEAVDYPVTITNGKFADDPQCGTDRNTVAMSEVVVIKTNDDTTPELDVPACDPLACTAATDEIVMTFNKRIVKSSYDISWLEVESASADNLPLTADDLKDNHYFVINDGVKDLTINTASVEDGDDYTEIRFTTKEKLVQGTTYTVEFKPWVVKDYIYNSPAGTIFEGFTSTFVVTDSEAPDEIALDPADEDPAVPSNKKDFSITFDEKIVRGEGVVQVRRLNGQIWAELDASDEDKVVINNKTKTLTLKFSKLANIADMDDFTQFYVYMDEGFVYDSVRTNCPANAFEGFDARLGKDGSLIDADWTFYTTDATPPMLVSMYPTQSDAPIALDANLEIVLDENIFTDQVAANPATWIQDAGIVIYYNDGVDTENDFGNAVEFIPWSEMFNNPATPDVDRKIRVTGTDPDNGLTSDKIIIDPAQNFEKEGNYYIRVNGLAIEDGTGNSWASLNATHTEEWVAKNDIDVDGDGDAEWMFTVVNKAKPVLDIATTVPSYDGVNAAGVYNYFGGDNPTAGKVVGDLTMSFVDSEKKQPIDVVITDDEDLTVKIYEYYYNPESLDTEEKLRQTYYSNDGNITVVDNQVIIANVELDDDIQGDSLYYVTVDKGFVTTTPEDGSIYWDGIDNGFVWRFKTAADTTFLAGAEGPYIITPENGAVDLGREEADTLVVAFGEDVLVGTGDVVIYNAETKVEAKRISADKFSTTDSTLTVTVDGLADETSYYVVIEAGAVTDASTTPTACPEFGNETWWTFSTGDNSMPVATVTPADVDCLPQDFTLTFTYEDEDVVTVTNAAAVTVVDADGTDYVGEVIASETDTNYVAVTVVGVPDGTELTLSVAEGFVMDSRNQSAVVADMVMTVGDNEAPDATLTAPIVAVGVDTTVVEVTFNEKVMPVNAVASVNGTEYAMSTEDSIVFTFVAKDLVSDMINEVVIAKGAVKDMGCNALVNDSIILPFTVKDLVAPMATFIPNAPNKIDNPNGVVLGIQFGEAVSKSDVAGMNVTVFDEDDVAVVELAVVDFTTENDSLWLAPATDLVFGTFTVKVDSAAFVDNAAAEGAQAFVQTEDWTVIIADEEFKDDFCYEIQNPKDGETIYVDSVTLEIEFCTETLVLSSDETLNVFIADGSAEGVDIEVKASECTVEGSKLTIPVSQKLAENTTYTVTIDPGFVTDLAGNPFRGLVDGDLWNFTVADLTDPTVSLVEATINETDVDGVAEITSNELGTVYLVEENVALDVTAIEAAIADGKAVMGTVLVENVAVEVSTFGLAVGKYVAVAVDLADRMSAASTNMVTIEEEVVIPVVTIAEIQGTGETSPLEGDVVITQGVITSIDGSGYYIQDKNAAWSGVYVYDNANAGSLSAGAAVKVQATVAEFNGLTELKDVTSLEPVLMGLTIEPIEVTELSEMYESVRVTVVGQAPADATTNFKETATVGTYTLYFGMYNNEASYTWRQDYKYEVTGIVRSYNDNYQVYPYFEADIVNASLRDGIEANLAAQVKIYPNPFDAQIMIDVPSELEVTKAVISNIAGQIVKEVYNPENTIQTSELRSGYYFISLHTEEGVAKTQRITKR